jgi:hypothetical protein
MIKCKYIIFSDGTVDVPVVFGDSITHKTIKIDGYHAINAGFVDIENNKARCYGESDSLKLQSNPAYDAELIQYYILRN